MSPLAMNSATGKRLLALEMFGAEWFEFASTEYAGILEMVQAGELGGVFVRARAAAGDAPPPPETAL